MIHIFLISDLNTCLTLMYDHANQCEANVKQMTNAHISEMRQDIKISSTYLESAANFTSDRCAFIIL